MTGAMTDDHVLDKVRKLLAKAERTTNEAEARAFSQKAAELMAARRLDPARLAARDGDELTIAEIFLGPGPYLRARVALLDEIARSFDAVTVLRLGSGRATVAGFASDLEAIRVLYTSMHAQAAMRMAAHHGPTAAETLRWRRSFLFGFARQVGDMLERAESAAASDDDQRMMPAILDRAQQIRDFADRRFGRRRTMRPGASMSSSAIRAGEAAARSADLGRQRLRRRPALPA